MEYRKAHQKDCGEIYELVQETIKNIYPQYYPAETVEFFCRLHSRENILADIDAQRVGVLFDGHVLAGTGSRREDHITRVFVRPGYQGKGYGSYIIQTLEDEAAQFYKKVQLEASAPAEHLYENRGYITVELCRWEQPSGVVLTYKRMEKRLDSTPNK